MSNNNEAPSDVAPAADDLTIANANKDLVRNPLHGLISSEALNLSGNSDRGLNQESITPRGTSLFNNRSNSISRDSAVGIESRNNYKKTTEVAKILPEFDEKNIPVNRFIMVCKDAEKFVDPNDQGFFLRLVKSRVIAAASDYFNL